MGPAGAHAVGRIVAIIAAILSLIRFPLGTALGIWTLIVLLGYRNTTLYEQFRSDGDLLAQRALIRRTNAPPSAAAPDCELSRAIKTTASLSSYATSKRGSMRST